MLGIKKGKDYTHSQITDYRKSDRSVVCDEYGGVCIGEAFITMKSTDTEDLDSFVLTGYGNGEAIYTCIYSYINH